MTQLTLFGGPSAPRPHQGRPVIRRAHGRVLILCPAGHLVFSVKDTDWAGSQPEANMRTPGYTVTCHGALPEDIR
ncbi:hypothetical protein AB0F88_17105 [Streptosporangium sp. NPDC023963]|uniref:hypothetical protein n=1 Tax=Streptosporangium sp. NPDC023963 TaxID=3155608 RepID=UPI00341C7110